MKTTSIRTNRIISEKLKALKEVLKFNSISETLDHLIRVQILSFSKLDRHKYNMLIDTFIGKNNQDDCVENKIKYPKQVYDLLKLAAHYKKTSVSDIVIDIVEHDFSNRPKLTATFERILDYKNSK